MNERAHHRSRLCGTATARSSSRRRICNQVDSASEKLSCAVRNIEPRGIAWLGEEVRHGLFFIIAIR
jgi:hypothetical protein